MFITLYVISAIYVIPDYTMGPVAAGGLFSVTRREKVNYQHFFQKAPTDHDLRGNTMKLFKQRSRLDCRKYSFGQRIVTDWNSLPTDVVESTSVNSFKNHLDKYWSDRM